MATPSFIDDELPVYQEQLANVNATRGLSNTRIDPGLVDVVYRQRISIIEESLRVLGLLYCHFA
jgi:hypothetical protein